MIHVSSSTINAAALAMIAASAVSLPSHAEKATTVAAPVTSNTVMQLSESDCKVFAGMTLRVIESIGRKKLSDDFVKAMVDFGVTRRCAGPYNIPTRGSDIAAYSSITGILYGNGISLEKIGVRQVKPTAELTQN
ncbi:MAG: hypothetical protein ABL901_17870 [Hyphomicrobiaceae bacterium]